MAGKLNQFGFIKVAAAVPTLKVGDVDYNLKQTLTLAEKAAKLGASVAVFPELGLTGYTCADLFHQRNLLKKAKEALIAIKKASRNLNAVLVAGLPFSLDGKIFNIGAVVSRGEILGLVPKTYIPGYKEFYEERWFASARDLIAKETLIDGKSVPVGTDLLFRFKNMPEAVLGLEICEDLWVPIPPSSFQVVAGATIIANLSASNDLVGKADYRKNLIAQQSARGVCGYIYSSCGVHESTTDVVFGGHALIAENGNILSENQRFSRTSDLIFSDIDLEHLSLDRERQTSFGESIHESARKNFRFADVPLPILAVRTFDRHVNPWSFVPQDPAERSKRAEEIFAIQSAGLVKRLEQAGIKNLVIGVSGGLDSTLALLVAVKTAGLLGLPLKNIHTYTLPGFATTKRTKSNALKLAEALGVSIETIDITKGALQQLKDISHDTKTQDLTFENVQARYRTLTLMDKANQLGGIVVGTGDLSEIALGWNTFTGDQISHYNVNASIPKLLVKYLVEWVSEQGDFVKAKKVLRDILATPISPELVRSGKKGITQKTEDLVGPYELHDFFLYHFLRWGSSPRKILFLAENAFDKKYKPETIHKWLKVFVTRFFRNQWKRSVMPDGPKVGSVALSPRGDWRMPSDAEVNLWLKEL
ncbi:MAG: NAD(+) synthase [Candidatus Harrisonbacteria bacterium]|nr:NAD(+) synthase [Candidatus Harrisonbacteria bacterium]